MVTGDIVIFQDADLEYNPEDYKKLIAPFKETDAQVVYGTRFLGENMQDFIFLAFYSK